MPCHPAMFHQSRFFPFALTGVFSRALCKEVLQNVPSVWRHIAHRYRESDIPHGTFRPRETLTESIIWSILFKGRKIIFIGLWSISSSWPTMVLQYGSTTTDLIPSSSSSNRLVFLTLYLAHIHSGRIPAPTNVFMSSTQLLMGTGSPRTIQGEQDRRASTFPKERQHLIWVLLL